MKELPEKFHSSMKNMFGESEYGEFIKSLSMPGVSGLRVNELKTDAYFLESKLKFLNERVPWCDTGFYFSEGDRPSKSALYQAGLFYIQEPSAMLPAALLEIREGDKVLDICAAPGGKTTQLASKLKGTGLIVSNDNKASRCIPLVKNIEQAGIKNCVVTNDVPERLSLRLPGFFDKILVDAPCSGEGMFRKDTGAVSEWERYSPSECSVIQLDILVSCAKMLKQGGMMSYSTCTFNTTENEGTVEKFLGLFGEFELVSAETRKHGISAGLNGFTGCARIFPHKAKGEGHFTAIFRKKDGRFTRYDKNETVKSAAGAEFGEFRSKYISDGFFVSERFERRKDHLYLLPEDLPDMRGIKVVRPGLYLGEVKGAKFEPSQALAMALRSDDFSGTVSFDSESRQVSDYLAGLSFDAGTAEGYNLFCCDGHPLGFGKTVNGRMKNRKLL